MTSSHITLITGAARSGKSEWAEFLAMQQEEPVLYLATAQMNDNDPDWQQRIERHRKRRPAHWQTLEVPMAIAQTIRNTPAFYCLLIDSVGTWVANHLTQTEAEWQESCTDFLSSLQQTQSQKIIVAEETGWGVVPAYDSGRCFRDRLGKLTRQIGAIANPVYLIVGGQVLNLSQIGQPLPSSNRKR